MISYTLRIHFHGQSRRKLMEYLLSHSSGSNSSFKPWSPSSSATGAMSSFDPVSGQAVGASGADGLGSALPYPGGTGALGILDMWRPDNDLDKASTYNVSRLG